MSDVNKKFEEEYKSERGIGNDGGGEVPLIYRI